MPLTNVQLQSVVNNLRQVTMGHHAQRTAFMALLPALNISPDEAETEFQRVISILRYIRYVDGDVQRLRSLSMHLIPCSVQANRGFRWL